MALSLVIWNAKDLSIMVSIVEYFCFMRLISKVSYRVGNEAEFP